MPMGGILSHRSITVLGRSKPMMTSPIISNNGRPEFIRFKPPAKRAEMSMSKFAKSSPPQMEIEVVMASFVHSVKRVIVWFLKLIRLGRDALGKKSNDFIK